MISPMAMNYCKEPPYCNKRLKDQFNLKLQPALEIPFQKGSNTRTSLWAIIYSQVEIIVQVKLALGNM